MMRYTEYHAGMAVIKDKTKIKEAMQRLAELEEWDTAKKCSNVSGEKLRFANCPTCGRRISDVEGGRFCQNCGQRLDWSE